MKKELYKGFANNGSYVIIDNKGYLIIDKNGNITENEKRI